MSWLGIELVHVTLYSIWYIQSFVLGLHYVIRPLCIYVIHSLLRDDCCGTGAMTWYFARALVPRKPPWTVWLKRLLLYHSDKRVPRYDLHNEFILKLIHWGRMTYICVGKLIIIGSDNGLSAGLNQCWNIVIWTPKTNWTHGNKWIFQSKFIPFHSRKSIWKCSLKNGGSCLLASMF